MSTNTKDDKKLFFTTSDLMNTMNQALMADPSDPLQPKFELQRRLPDGSTRRADESEVAAADMDSKVQQAAKLIELLTPSQRLDWAQQQRQEGNDLYRKGDYPAAMDVYLTCLVAKPSGSNNNNNSDSDNTLRDFLSLVFLPVMNNLAQCALQLSMCRKAEQFVTMALEELDKCQTDEHIMQSDPKLLSKLYFRRGKARRLSGSYESANNDFQQSIELLSDEDLSERRAIEHELALLQRAENEAKRNERRQQRAMKKVIGGEGFVEASSLHGDKASRGSAVTEANFDSRQSKNSDWPEEVRPRRKYSTLRARRPADEKAIKDTDEMSQISYWQWYLALIGRVAERLLLLIGDDEQKASRETDQDKQRSKVN